MAILERLRNETLRFLLPWVCAGCRSPLSCLQDEGFCGRCWLSIPRIQGLACRACGLPLKDGGAFCFTCRSTPFGVFLRAATTYTGVMPGALHRFKYAGRQSLAAPFGVLLDYAWRRTPEFQSATALVPVPLHPSAEKARGYNQAALLARALSSRIHLPIREDILYRHRRTTPQIRLKKEERRQNLENAFALSSRLKSLEGEKVVLIDDVGTTGSTLVQGARTLRRAGAAWVGALVLARDL